MGELYNADSKPINLCSFYCPPDNNVHSVISLVNHCINYILTTRCKMQQTEQLYDKAKQYQTEET